MKKMTAARRRITVARQPTITWVDDDYDDCAAADEDDAEDDDEDAEDAGML